MIKEIRHRITVSGLVQGVGFRPFCYRLARDCGVEGWVRNDSGSVVIEVQGSSQALKEFMQALENEPPTNARINSVRAAVVAPQASRGFEIIASNEGRNESQGLAADYAVCEQCIADLYSPSSRYYQYAFTSCTECGPRYSISQTVPFDRARSAMAQFPLCADCAAVYKNPDDRRFHAQVLCCEHCGPQLELCDSAGCRRSLGQSAIEEAAGALRDGALVAFKGIGGFQLLCDARNSASIKRLRAVKSRPAKPLALMVKDEQELTAFCSVTQSERMLFSSPQAPIVLIDQPIPSLAEEIAPGLHSVGLMRATTAGHHLLLTAFSGPLVVSSANVTGEPIISDASQMLESQAGKIDFLLTHDREIVHPLDDSVARIARRRPLLLRRARGYAPGGIEFKNVAVTALGVGGQSKNTVALADNMSIKLSPYLGELDSLESHRRFSANIDYLLAQPTCADKDLTIVHDWHPEYDATELAMETCASAAAAMSVQHHVAHVCAVMVDNALKPPCFGVAWDGNGYGAAFAGDAQVWGGECFSLPESGGCHRVMSVLNFPLVGGTQAIKEPRRSALGLLFAGGVEMREHLFARQYCRSAFDNGELLGMNTMLDKEFNSPMCSSIGRLFDGVSALLGLTQKLEFEAQAACMLEQLALDYSNASVTASEQGAYAVQLLRSNWFGAVDEHHPLFRAEWLMDWRPLLTAILDDKLAAKDNAYIAYHFHYALAQSVVSAAKLNEYERVVLSGGCFQNACLLELCVQQLEQHGFDVYSAQHLPANDGALAVGQVYAAQLKGVAGGPYYSRS